MTADINGEDEINIQNPKSKKDKVDSFYYSILDQKDYTTPLTRRFNRQPRIYANKIDFDQDNDKESFLFSKTKTKDDLFQESQERVMHRIETIIQSQNSTFNDSFREIDEMSQENEDHLEKIEKYLEKLKAKIMKRRISQQKENTTKASKSKGPAQKKASTNRNQRADSLMQLNQEQLK